MELYVHIKKTEKNNLIEDLIITGAHGILVDELTVNELAGTPPKLTALTLAKFVPAIFTVVPVIPDVGVNDTMLGSGFTLLI
jgi:hypothetical protein